jgi:hypothetical protein
MPDDFARIRQIKDALSQLGPLLPGSISTQWNVCGKQGCRCKDPKKPRKHGPYYQLSFTVDGKSSSLFVKKAQLKQLRDCIKRYRRFRELNTRLLAAYIQWARNGGLHQAKEDTADE